ncbi:hypothetical protein [Embleya sp. NPDC050493]|uniref:hypothetical protein n=1 Tax=Embleya sp. NPDC050493 TaxID=3363989 RepID=UPI0037A5A9BC
MAEIAHAEPAAWTRWVSSITALGEPGSAGDDGLRCVETGVLFDVVVVARQLAERVVERLTSAGTRIGPVSGYRTSAQFLVPLGVSDCWDELVDQFGVSADVSSRCMGPGCLIRLPAQSPGSSLSAVWLVTPPLDEGGLPILTDPHDLVLAMGAETP